VTLIGSPSSSTWRRLQVGKRNVSGTTTPQNPENSMEHPANRHGDLGENVERQSLRVS
jgi:hypothetical protein